MAISDKIVIFAFTNNNMDMENKEINVADFFSLLEVRIEDRICFITMNNAAHFNCLSEEMCGQLNDALTYAYTNHCVGIVLKANTRHNVWSAGHDIKELPLDGRDPLSFDVPMEKLLRHVQDVPIPVIACVDGTVWGGACDLCVSCDMIVASSTSTFAITPAKIGIPYNASGIIHFIKQLSLNKAREMFFTAAPITAEDANNVGFVNRVAPSEELDALLEERFLKPLRRNSVMSISAIKRQFRIIARASSMVSAENFERINSYRARVYQGQDYPEGVRSFLEKRDPVYTGKAEDLDTESWY